MPKYKTRQPGAWS